MDIAEKFMDQATTNTMKRINEQGHVIGTVIVNIEGFPETTTLDSMTAATYSVNMRSLAAQAKLALLELDASDKLLVVRMVTKKTEAVVAPDPEFHLIVVMTRNK